MDFIISPITGLRQPGAEMLPGAADPAAFLKKQDAVEGTGQTVAVGVDGPQAVQLEHRNRQSFPRQLFRSLQHGEGDPPIGHQQNPGVASPE